MSCCFHLTIKVNQEELVMTIVHHRYARVDGRRLFYREAGRRTPRRSCCCTASRPARTCSATSSRCWPARYHVIAPDQLGFGLSDAPSVDEFDYTFDALADLTDGLLQPLGVDRYAMYVQDYGAPIGWRLALQATRAGHRDRHAERQRVRRRASSRTSGSSSGTTDVSRHRADRGARSAAR